jgi:hypothetical protein
MSTGVCSMNLSDAAEENRSANTRENEGPCFCDGCTEDSDICGFTPEECVKMHIEMIADDKVKARKEES